MSRFLRGTDPKFPVGTIVKNKYASETYEVIEWSRFYDKFKGSIEASEGDDRLDWESFIPILGRGGAINGLKPENLSVVEQIEVEAPPEPEKIRGTIEI